MTNNRSNKKQIYIYIYIYMSIHAFFLMLTVPTQHIWSLLLNITSNGVLLVHYVHSWCIMSTMMHNEYHDAPWVLMSHQEYAWCIRNTLIRRNHDASWEHASLSIHGAPWALMMHHEHSWHRRKRSQSVSAKWHAFWDETEGLPAFCMVCQGALFFVKFDLRLPAGRRGDTWEASAFTENTKFEIYSFWCLR